MMLPEKMYWLAYIERAIFLLVHQTSKILNCFIFFLNKLKAWNSQPTNFLLAI